MNWRNVARLVNVDIKAGRIVRGRELRRYREKQTFQYLLYGGASVLGLVAGILLGLFYAGASLDLKNLISQSVGYIYPSIPTLIFIYSLVFTMMGQLQKMGVKASAQLPYWLPISWEEHTLASVLANLIGVPLASLVGMSLALVSFSVFLGQLPFGLLTVFALLASAFLASVTSEIFSVLQSRLLGAVYKSSGKAAVWVRFVGTLVFFIIFYIVWIFMTSGASTILLNLQLITGAQLAIWFVPFIWLGMILASFVEGSLVGVLIFSLASVIFIAVLFYIGVALNSKFGLYEPPAITVSKGVYTPRVSFFRKLGFSPLEAAIISKDFKAFTRRRELISLFIVPVVFVIIPLMQYLGLMGQPVTSDVSPFLSAELFLMPGALTAIMLGTMNLGQEGSSVWMIYSSPISARSLVKCKYAVVVILSSLVMLACGVVGVVVSTPSFNLFLASLLESFFLIFALAAVSVGAGIRGADFVEAPRPKMVNPMTALLSFILAFVLSLVILSPVILYVLGGPLEIFVNIGGLYTAISLSAVISIVVTYFSYKLAIRGAEAFLRKAEA